MSASKKNTIRQTVDKLLATDDPRLLDYTNKILNSIFSIQDHNLIYNDVKLIQKTLDELVESILIFKDYRHTRKVSMFGSARTLPDHPNYSLAEETAKQFTQAGIMVVTGAGPGIMEAGNKGAGEDNSFGLHIYLPFEQEPNKFIMSSEKMIPYHYFFVRKLMFVKESDAIILFPGGFGTQDEGFEVLTLMQTGRCSPRPIILINYDKSTYWESWKHYVKTQLLERQYISEEDMDLFKELSTPEEICKEVIQFYSVYHSIEYYEAMTCIRLNRSLSPKSIEQINSTFSHLLESGSFKLTDHRCFKEEACLYPEKPRLVFHFNRSSYGHLLKLIHFINTQ